MIWATVSSRSCFCWCTELLHLWLQTICCESSSVVSNSLWPHGLYRPWNSPGQNNGVGNPFSSPEGLIKEYNQSDFSIDHLVMSMCRVISCCWKRVFAMTSAFSWQNSVSLYPVSFCTPRPNLPVTPGISWLPTFAFQSPMMKRTSFLGVSFRRSCRYSQNHSTLVSSALLVGA